MIAIYLAKRLYFLAYEQRIKNTKKMKEERNRTMQRLETLSMEYDKNEDVALWLARGLLFYPDNKDVNEWESIVQRLKSVSNRFKQSETIAAEYADGIERLNLAKFYNHD